MKYLLLIVSFFVMNNFCFAQEQLPVSPSEADENPEKIKLPKLTEKRKNNVGVELMGGEENYREVNIAGGWGIDPIWKVTGSVSGVQNTDETRATQFRLGGNATPLEPLMASASLLFQKQPNDVTGLGVAPGISYEVSSLWDAEELMTNVYASAELIRYKQKVAGGRLPGKSLNERFTEKTFMFGMSQDVCKALTLALSYSRHLYTQPTHTLSSIMGKRTFVFSGSSQPQTMNTIDGFPTSTLTPELAWEFSKHWTLALSFSSSDNAESTDKIRTYGAGLEWEMDKSWTFAATASHSRQVNVADFTAASLGVDYAW